MMGVLRERSLLLPRHPVSQCIVCLVVGASVVIQTTIRGNDKEAVTVCVVSLNNTNTFIHKRR